MLGKRFEKELKMIENALDLSKNGSCLSIKREDTYLL